VVHFAIRARARCQRTDLLDLAIAFSSARRSCACSGDLDGLVNTTGTGFALAKHGLFDVGLAKWTPITCAPFCPRIVTSCPHKALHASPFDGAFFLRIETFCFVGASFTT
jgi:hypothetical protein